MSASQMRHKGAIDMVSRYGLAGRVAIVSGASGLLGGAICRELALFGVHIVAGCHRNRNAVEQLSRDIALQGGRCVPVAADLSQASGADVLKAAALDTFERLDIVVATAGVILRSPALMTNAVKVREMMTVNIESSMTLSRVGVRAMLANGWGRVVLIGSRAGIAGLPGQAAYAATKGALSSWASSLAGEVGKRGITVNVVAPGAVRNPDEKIYSPEEERAVCDSIGAGRLGEAEEVASVVSFLCSESAGYINGTTIAVDGGARF